jgi:hypothetical protein
VQKTHADPVRRVGGFAMAVTVWLVAGWVAKCSVGPTRTFALVPTIFRFNARLLR